MIAIAGLVIAALAAVDPADTCSAPSLIPAYAHNDYRNRRPLVDALERGYRGVEVDLFRVGAELLVGHEQRELRSAYTLSRLYLEPLRERYHACRRLLPDGAPFFLNIELKEADSVAFQFLFDELHRYEELFRSERGAGPAIQVTLVGWWPVGGTLQWPDYLRVQIVAERTAMSSSDRPVGLVSIDYGKSLHWRGRGAVPNADKTTLSRARELAAGLGVPLRVHHVPHDTRIYQWLLSENVSLIGATDLGRTRQLLTGLHVQPR